MSNLLILQLSKSSAISLFSIDSYLLGAMHFLHWTVVLLFCFRLNTISWHHPPKQLLVNNYYYLGLVYHSSKIRGLCLMKCSSIKHKPLFSEEYWYVIHEQNFKSNYQLITGIYLIWTIISAILTLIAWAIEIIPMEANEFAPFFALTNRRFVLMISFPYLFALGIVFGCDMIALLVAILKKNQMNSSAKTNSKNFSSSQCKFRFLLHTTQFDQRDSYTKLLRRS